MNQPHPCLCAYCIRKGGTITAHFRQEHNTHTETGKFIYKGLTLHVEKQLLIKRDRLRSHKSAV